MLKDFASRLSYPNPFKPSGIEFDLPADGLVTVEIYDDSGKEIATVTKDAPFIAGTHRLEFNLSHDVHGICFYRIKVDSDGKQYIDTKALTLMK